MSGPPITLGYARAVVAVRRWLDPWMRNRLFRKYVVPFVAVVSWALLTNGLLEIYFTRSEEHTSELQSRPHLVCRLLLEKKKKKNRSQRVHRDRVCDIAI